jgi:hypothetical protein
VVWYIFIDVSEQGANVIFRVGGKPSVEEVMRIKGDGVAGPGTWAKQAKKRESDKLWGTKW